MIILVIFSFLFFSSVKAQNPSSTDVVSNFQPSLAVVVGVLSILFSITFLLLLYAKFCHRTSSSVHNANNLHIRDGLLRSASRSSGIDKTLVESLPFFRFSSLKGSKQGLECSVCLSKFEDIEILRLLPKCKHAFHIDCIDQWLEKHSTCPLCRHKVSVEDVSPLPFSDSFRFLSSDRYSELTDESSRLELFVEREENDSQNRSSSRFSIGGSFRKSEKLPIQEKIKNGQERKARLHKLNHRIVVSDVVFKNRWSNVSSSDLIFLNSEMVNDMVTSNRFSSMDRIKEKNTAKRVIEEGQETNMDIKDEMERKRLFEYKIKKNDLFQESSSSSKVVISENERRSMSEIIVHPRFMDFNNKISVPQNNVKEERRRKLWLPIARRTVKWFANREKRSAHTENV